MDLSANFTFSLFGNAFTPKPPQPPVVVNIMPQQSSNSKPCRENKKKKTTKKKKKTASKKKQQHGQVINPRYHPPYQKGNYDPIRSHPHRPRLMNGDYDRYRKEEKALTRSNDMYHTSATKNRWPVVHREAPCATGQKQNRSYHGVTKKSATATRQKQNSFHPAYPASHSGTVNRSYAGTRSHGNNTCRQVCESEEEEESDEEDEESDEEDEEESEEEDDEESECEDEEESEESDEDEEDEEEEESDCEETVHYQPTTRRGWERSREEYQHSRRAYHRY